MKTVALLILLAVNLAPAAPPATTQSTAARTLRFADAVPLRRLRKPDNDIDLRNQITLADKSTIYFGQVDTLNADGDTTATSPILVAKRTTQWLALDFSDQHVTNAEFLFVAAGPAKNEIWTILDNNLDNPAKVLLLAHSTDAGQTWTLTTIHKPHGSGSYDSFAMDKSGHGRLTIYLTPHQAARNRAGFYHLRTTDDGQTWSAPQYEADSLQPADEVPADEDPEPLQQPDDSITARADVHH